MQRATRRNRCREDCVGVVESLNWCSMGAVGPTQVDAGIHSNVVDLVERRVRERGFPPDRETNEAAARELLGARLGYHQGASTVEPFRRGAVSLPARDDTAPWLLDVLPEEDRRFLLKAKEHLLKDVAETMELLDHGPPIEPYMDVELARDEELYMDFVLDLESRGLVSFTRTPKARATLFFVRKKGNQQRMIVDARASNRLFRDPPSVKLASPESFGGMEIASGGAFQATADISNYFHRLKIGKELGEYFSLPGISARVLNYAHFEGTLLRGDEMIYPYMAVLPMGFSWSVWFAQRASVCQISKSPLLATAGCVSSGAPDKVLGETAGLTFYVYIDNIGVIGDDREKVNAALGEAVALLEGQGLTCHEVSPAAAVSEALGIEFNAHLRCFRPTSRRYWRLRRAISWVLQVGVLSGRALEVILGHCTFFAMLERSTLSIFASCYKFVKASYVRRSALWPTVIAELRAFRGIMPMVVAEWGRSWADEVWKYDSCPGGFGCVSASRDLGTIKELGRERERARFKKNFSGPRARALRDLGPDDPLSICSLPPIVDDIKEEWDLNANFEEVPLPFLRRSAWKVRLAGPWAYRAAVHIGEARAGVMSVGLLAKSLSNHGKRHLVIGDNLGVTLAFERKRASAFPLLVQIRRLASLSLASNMFIAWRWVPSEYNAADQPSRNHDLRPGDFVSLSPFREKESNALQLEIRNLGGLLEAKDEELSPAVARAFPSQPSAPAVLDNAGKFAKAPPTQQKPCSKEKPRPALVEARGQSGQTTCSGGLASVAEARSSQEVVQNYGGHESGPFGDKWPGRGPSIQREFGGGVGERRRQQEAQKGYEAVRKVLGPGGEWKRVKTFFAGDKGGDAGLRGSVPKILRGIPGLLRGEGLRHKNRPRHGFRVSRFLLGYVLRGVGTEQGRKDPGSSHGKPAKIQYGGRLDSAKGEARFSGLEEAFSTEVAHSAYYLCGGGACGFADQGGRARDGSFRTYGFRNLRSPGQLDGPSPVIASGPPGFSGPLLENPAAPLAPQRAEQNRDAGRYLTLGCAGVRVAGQALPHPQSWGASKQALAVQLLRPLQANQESDRKDADLFRALPVATLGRELGYGEKLSHTFGGAKAWNVAHNYVPGEVREAREDDQRIRTHPLGDKGLVRTMPPGLGGDPSAWKTSV